MEPTKVRIGLVEIGDSFGGEYYLPYSLGVLTAYAQSHLRNLDLYEFGRIIYKRDGIEKETEYLLTMDVVFFSMYLWNSRISLEIAKSLKAKNKGIITVFGGPQVPGDPGKMGAFLEKHGFVDVACYGEGEVPFLQTLENCGDRQWENVPSIGYRREDGRAAVTPVGKPILDVDEIPSPYLSGLFDELITLHPDEKWLGRLETNRGCPFTCAFCYWGRKADRKVRSFGLDRVFQEIDWFSRQRVEFIFCCDANFGLMTRDLNIARKVAENKAAFGFPKVFSVQNTKNSKETTLEVQRILNSSGLQKGVNLALQSTNPETLRFIERSNIDNGTYAELQKSFTKTGIPTFTDIIVGLPGETYETFAGGVSDIIANGQHNRIQFINLTILENTLMSEPEYQLEHDLKIIETAYVSHHSSLGEHDRSDEVQSLVVGAKTMPERDWVRARVFAWMTSLLHFDKLLQIPFVILHEMGRYSYRELVETFLEEEGKDGIIGELTRSFYDKAHEIQRGGTEYSASKEWLNITWYPDELAFIRLSAESGIAPFYDEARRKLVALSSPKVPVAVVLQATALNQSLLKQPFLKENKVLRCDYDLWKVYQMAMRGENCEMERGDYLYEIDATSQKWASWEEWCREVIWYGNKKGDYIYSVKTKKREEGV